MINKEYFGLSKIDLFDGVVDCSVNYKGTVSSNDFEKIVKSINSKGNCTSGKIKVSGVDFAQIAKTVDQINDFPSLIKIINKKTLVRNQNLKRLHLNLKLRMVIFYIMPLKAFHKNLTLNTNGNFNILKDYLTLDSKAYFKTIKYKDLPAVGISMVGASASPEVSYDLSELKQKFLMKVLKKF